MDIQSVLKDTFFAQGEISFREMGDFCKSPSQSIRFISFDNSIIQELNTHFPILNIKDALGTRFDQINRLAITESLYNKIGKLLHERYLILEKHQTQIALIVSFCIPTKDKPKFHNAGKAVTILSELSRLKRLIQEKVEIDLGFINPEESEIETVKDYHPKYRINKVIVELKDYNDKIESIKMKIYDGKIDNNYPISEKVKLDNLLIETFEEIFKSFNVTDSYSKKNTNQLFCQQFFSYINSQTPFSINNGKSEREILTFFTDIYKFTKHKFPKTNDEVELVEKWLKPTRK
jgi:hypothetical protein